MRTKKKLLFEITIFFDHFYPAYKAGGPIQSLTNLLIELNGNAITNVVTSAFDLNSDVVLEDIKPNSWNVIKLDSRSNINVWYDKGDSDLFALLKQTQSELIYLNGMFTYRFVLKPLIISRLLKLKSKIVVCPRGMLQKGALSVKPLKKKVYLSILKHSGLLKNIRWHATNEEECEDIKKSFGKNAQVIIAPNIPKRPLESFSKKEKKLKSLKLVYLSLIAEKKNLLQLINLVKSCHQGITLDIYGPVKDRKYWEKCQRNINEVKGRIIYKGDIKPENVQVVIGQYDAFALLTKGENFGHALYESLSVGCPIITSFFTPWNNLEENKAGWNLNIDDFNACAEKLNRIAELTNEQFTTFKRGAHVLACDYYKNLNAIEKYKELFSITS